MELNHRSQYISDTDTRIAVFQHTDIESQITPLFDSEKDADNRILIVGDDQQMRATIARTLTDNNYRVSTASSGMEAILLYHKERFSLVFTDTALADMTGFELLNAIRSMNFDVQIIFMTTYSSEDNLLEALRAGVTDYIVKPEEDIDQLLAAARRAYTRICLQKENKQLIEKLKFKTEALKKANALLENIAIHDNLTGLYNHRYFQNRISAEIHRCQRYGEFFSLLFIDLDHFKNYNDINGHMEGDELLKTIARLFMDVFRTTDSIARYGGDEFVVILPETNFDQAVFVGNKLCREVAEFPFGGIDCMPDGRITISIGCASYPKDGTTTNDLLRSADQALYKAKAEGRGKAA